MLTILLSFAAAGLQPEPALPVSVYRRADQMLPTRAAELVLRDKLVPNWIGGTDRFWYRVRTDRGVEFVYVDPAARVRRPAFDHRRLAAALEAAAGTRVAPDSLPFASLGWREDGRSVSLDVAVGGKWFRCEVANYRCPPLASPAPTDPNELRSPDGRWALYREGPDLGVRRLDTGERRRLTRDGAPRNQYGADPEFTTEWVTNRRMGVPTPPVALWSPDSRRVLVQQIDERAVPETHLVQTIGVPRPKVWSFAYPLVGDSVGRGTWWIFEPETGRAVRTTGAPVPVDLTPFLVPQEAWWGDSAGTTVYYVERARGSRAWWLRAIDAATGGTTTIAEERGRTFVEPGISVGSRPLVHVTADRREVIWYSSRDGWAHLYLMDAATGRIRNQITRGEYVVQSIVKVDERARRIWFLAGGREPGRNPYLLHLYSVGFDGTGLVLLTPEDAHHQVTLGAGGQWLIDRYSRPDLAPVTVARSLDGKTVVPLERADLSRLLATGWRWPVPFVAKAADGVTDVYGILYQPSDFDSTRKYPVVEEIYPGPQRINVPRAFEASIDDRALAELGMIGVRIDGRGTPFRSKAFHDHAWGNLQAVGGLEDHIAALRQLATTHRYLDLDRVGIYGSSAGGFGSVRAILTYPDFYKVAVSINGYHDSRGYLPIWGETYQAEAGSTRHDSTANARLAGALRGKLLLAWGELDDNVPPAHTIGLIDALIRANRDFDILLLPNASHFAAANMYFRRKRWDYFVQHLLGKRPPADYVITAPVEVPHAGTQP